MKAIRGILRDLIERRLWPVAVLLLAAALAVPVYLGRSSGEHDTPLPPATEHADLGKTSKAAVTLDTDDQSGAGRGSVRNPFKQLHVPKPQDTGTTGTTNPTPNGKTPATGGTGGAGGGDGSLPPLGPAGGTGGAKEPAPKPETDSRDLYHISVKVGRADGTMRTLKDVARLSPLPSVDDPFMVYTGVLKDGKTAVFLLSSDAKATGDGKCKPSKDDCESVEVKKGDTEFFDLTVDGQPVQYELDVLDVKRQSAAGSSSSATASAAVASERHSNAGAKLLRTAHVKSTNRFKGASSYRWLPDQGVLVRAPKHGSAQASVTGATAASPADAAALLPGQPVWHWKLGA